MLVSTRTSTCFKYRSTWLIFSKTVTGLSSIEKTLFDKKRLNEELKNLTVSSNLLVKVLTVVPIVFILIIYLLNPSYFNILFTSSMGYMIIILIVLMFIIYIIVLQRIMKVKV